MSEDRLRTILSRLEEIIREHPELFRRRTKRRPRAEGSDEPTPVPQPSFWWSAALATHPEFVRRGENLCRRIEFNATSMHKLAAFARVRYRNPECGAGVVLSVQITECPLTGTHCDGDPSKCKLGNEGRFKEVVLQEAKCGILFGVS